MLATLKNGQLAKKSFVYQKKKKMCEEFLKVLWNEGFILGYRVSTKNPNLLKIFLKYNNNQPVINSIQPLTKPSKRIYYTIKQIWKFEFNKNCIIVSTNKGFKTILECKKLKIGGEPFVLIK